MAILFGIMELPLEIYQSIFINLSEVNLAICKLVCRDWYNAIETLYDTDSVITESHAVCLLLEQNDLRNAQKFFSRIEKKDSNYIRSAIKSGSYETVRELMRCGFTLQYAYSSAIRYHQNDIYFNLRIIGVDKSHSINETIELCVEYGNLKLLKRLLSIMDINMDNLFNDVVHFDQLQIFQWLTESLNYQVYDKEINLKMIAKKTNHIIGFYFENVRNGKIEMTTHLLNMYRDAITNQNYWFFKHGWEFINEFEGIKKCRFLVEDAIKYMDYDFWEKLVDHGLEQVVSFGSLIQSSLPTEKILKYLDYTHCIGWESWYFVYLVKRDNIKLLDYAKSRDLSYDFDCYQFLSLKQREWAMTSGYPIILPTRLHSRPIMKRFINKVLGNKGLCYVYRNMNDFYQFLKPYYESYYQIQLRDGSILYEIDEVHQPIIFELILYLYHPKPNYYLDNIQEIIVELCHHKYYSCLEHVFIGVVNNLDASQINILFHIDDDTTLKHILGKIDISLNLKCIIAKKLVNMNRYEMLKWLFNEYQEPSSSDEDKNEEDYDEDGYMSS